MPEEGKSLRQRCWDSAFNAFSTAFVFERRSQRFHKRLQWLAFLGIGVPVLVGGLVLAYGTPSSSVAIVMPYAAALGVVQLVVSVWSLTSDWSGGLQRSSERIWVNHELAKGFADLGRTPPSDPAELQRSFDLLAAEEKVSERTDYQLHITPAENRAGYRAASRHFQRQCATCGQAAQSLQPESDCPTCGEPARLWSRRTSYRTLPGPKAKSLPATAAPPTQSNPR